jgi:hypothetical protein
VLGFVRQNQQTQNEVEIAFDAKLTLDSELRSLASDQLALNGQSVSGVFNNWHLASPKLIAEGISNYSIGVVGDTLQVTMDLDQNSGNLALWRLWTEEGLPMTLQFTCNDDPSVRGEFPISLSLLRRTRNKLVISNQNVTNEEKTSVVIQYFVLNGQIIVLNPAIVVPSGGSANLATPPGTDNSTATIQVPPEAVVYSGHNPFSLDEFDTSLTDTLIQTVTVQNLLESFNKQLNLPLMYADVTIHYNVESPNSSVERTAGPYKLAPRGAIGSTITVPFIRPNLGKFSFFITGTACYDQQCRSLVRIHTQPSSDLTLYIVEKSLIVDGAN